MKSSNKTHNASLGALVGAALFGWATLAPAAVTNGWNQTAAGTYVYTDAGNWFNGTVNDAFDPSLTLTGGDQTLTFGADYTTVGPLKFAHDEATGQTNNVNLRSDGLGARTLSLAGDVTFTPLKATTRLLRVGSTNAAEALALDLGAARTFNIGTAGGSSSGDPGGGVTLLNVVSNGMIIKTGVGWLRLGGIVDDLTANTFTNLIVSAGVVRLSKTNGVNAVNGDVLINGGTLVQSSNHQIPDTANVTITSGTWYVSASSAISSGNTPRSETINNLTISGGTLNTSPKGQGSAPTPGADTVLGTLRVTGGTLSIRTAVLTANRLEITASTLSLYNPGGSSMTYSRDSQLVVGSGGLAISNTASGAYTAITAGNWSRIRLGGDVVCDGNSGNTNTVTISASAEGAGGAADFRSFSLEGGTRTFTVNDGPAAVDLLIDPDFTIIGTASNGVGGITKAGLGTLEIDSTCTYTGTTDVAAGKLLVNGAFASAVTVNSGVLGGYGTLLPSTTVAVRNGGTLAPGYGITNAMSIGHLAMTDGATLAVDLNGPTAVSGYDQLSATGTVSLAGASLSAVLRYAPTDGDLFFILCNDGVDAIGGTFNGLPDGKLLTLDHGGKTYGFRISYFGDVDTAQTTGGNDIVLTAAEYFPSTVILVR